MDCAWESLEGLRVGWLPCRMLFLPPRILLLPGLFLGSLGCCKDAWSLILPCRMLGCTGNSRWRMPARNEPCSCCISLKFLVVELILLGSTYRIRLVVVVTGLHVETLETLLDSSWNEVLEVSFLGYLLSPFLWK